MEAFKILKTHIPVIPVSLYFLFWQSQRDTNMVLHLPKFALETSRNKYIFESSTLRNTLIDKIFEKSAPDSDGIIIRGSAIYSDFCATIPFIFLLKQQALGDEINWTRENAW